MKFFAVLCCRVKSYSTVLCSALLCSVESFAEVFFWFALCFAALCCCVVLYCELCYVVLCYDADFLVKLHLLRIYEFHLSPNFFSFVFIKTPSPGQVQAVLENVRILLGKKIV